MMGNAILEVSKELSELWHSGAFLPVAHMCFTHSVRIWNIDRGDGEGMKSRAALNAMIITLKLLNLKANS